MSEGLDAEIRGTIEKLIVLSPFGRLLGAVCQEVGADRVRVRLPFRPDVTTVGEMVHGGAIASLVDITATAAAWASPRATLGARGTTVGFSDDSTAPDPSRPLRMTVPSELWLSKSNPSLWSPTIGCENWLI